MNIEQAIALQNQALDLAKAKRVEIAVAITDGHGELISFAKMDGAAFHAAKLAQNKPYTSARDRQPTSNLAKWAKETGKDMGYWSDARFTGIAGGVPIIFNGDVVGGIGISGMSEQDDELFANEVLNAVK